MLLAKGHTVICIDNFLAEREANIAHIKDSRGVFSFVDADITGQIEIQGGLDYVFLSRP